MGECLRRHLLIAAPSLHDYFRRAVVMVLDHTEEGAMGVVLGRASRTAVADVVPQLAELPTSDELVHIGGPVSPQSVVAIGEFEDIDEADTRLAGSVGTVNPDGPNATLLRMRVFAGYAGWGPGQLDGEVEEEAWMITPLEPEDPFAEGDLWAAALRRKGGNYRLLATMPADPSLN